MNLVDEIARGNDKLDIIEDGTIRVGANEEQNYRVFSEGKLLGYINPQGVYDQDNNLIGEIVPDTQTIPSRTTIFANTPKKHAVATIHGYFLPLIKMYTASGARVRARRKFLRELCDCVLTGNLDSLQSRP
jgi:hypothetical protein